MAIAAIGLALTPSPAGAQPLNPLEFASLGTLDTSSHPELHSIDTDTLTFSGPGIDNPTHMLHGVARGSTAVFCFDGINIASGTTITVTGHRPLALLSKTTAFLGSGYINVRALPQGGALGSVGVAGGSSAGIGSGGLLPGGQGGGIGGGAGGSPDGLHPSGGSFGGGLLLNQQNAGGPVYGNLMLRLEGGSGGGGAWTGNAVPTFNDYGGAGGGAVEIGAIGWIGVESAIAAQGGDSAHGGGGSGGGILLHGAGVEIHRWVAQQVIDASGGWSIAGFNGAGGRILIQSHNHPDLYSAIANPGGPGALPGIVAWVHTAISVPPILDFGSVPVGMTKTLFLNVQSSGDPDSLINGQSLTNPSSAFALVGSNTFSGLRAGSTCAVAYSFTPQSEGEASAMASIYSDGGDPVYVQLHGVGGTTCGSSDFNGDGDFGTDQDIEAFFRVLAGGHC